MKRLVVIIVILCLICISPASANPIDDLWAWLTGKNNEVVDVPVYTNTSHAYNGGTIKEVKYYPGTSLVSVSYHMDTLPEQGGIVVSLYCPDSMGYWMSCASGDAFKIDGSHTFIVSSIDKCYFAMENNTMRMF